MHCEVNHWIFLYLKEKGNNLKEKGEIADMTEEEKAGAEQCQAQGSVS